MSRWIGVNKNGIDYSYNLSNLVSITYNEKTESLYLETVSGKTVEMTEISPREFKSIGNFIENC